MNDNRKCDDKLLTLYHFRELDTVQTRQLEEHLSNCKNCRAALEGIEQSLGTVPQRELTLSQAEKQKFTEQVMSKTRRTWWQHKQVWGSVLATTGALALALMILPTDVPPAPTSNPALADLEVLEQLELLQEFEILEDLELYEALEDFG